MEYQILSGGSIVGLTNSVNDAIKRGWIPHGGLCIRPVNQEYRQPEWYFQAMIKPAPPKTGTDKF